MLNTLWLKTFKTLIDLGHFTQTAEKLHMTQPGVSQHLKKLEQACGAVLLKRDKKQFELTEQGRLVYQYANELANRETRLIESLHFDNPDEGHCSIACSGAIALRLYPLLIELQKTRPNLAVHLEAAPSHKVINDVQSGEIDLGIVTYAPNGNVFDVTLIGKEALCLVLPVTYANREITPELLLQCGLIDHPDAKHYLSLYFERCGVKRFAEMDLEKIKVSGYVNQLSQILLPVEQGIGFTVLPQSAILAYPATERLYIANLGRHVSESLYLIAKRNRRLPVRYALIEQVLQTSLGIDG
ncbi:LysR family transcriptional regulator [Vibrio sp. SM6]|uniref:LysR family transcriptional regulator n=1 Tax=Vibrio agarilyticus TaxID=2726741 RepID=A0A7X8TTA4_9VIBR|nr:LysR family transcriptional regulator [Vibrio agarilyticus]NLS14403.1 LysR family transcriptional regulator [Vibrio agarilyticus]